MSIPLPKAPSSHLPSTRIDALWDADAPKYRVFCRRVHVLRAATIIGYAQLALLAIFTTLLLFVYGQAMFSDLPADHWVVHTGDKYLTSLVTAVGLQLCLVLMLLHGIRSERRSYLLPFIVFATLAAVMAGVQISFDLSHRLHGTSTLISHLIGIVIHVWCIHVMWRCYCYLGDKKVAEHIGEQLQATTLAFSFDYPQPPSYADVAASVPAEKRPLSMA